MQSRTGVAVALVLTAVIVIGGAWVGATEEIGLAATGSPGLYRSAQPSPAALREITGRLQLKTVVNLRGDNPGAEWFEEERVAAATSGVRMLSLTFETFEAPSRLDTLALVDALESGARPMLLHCLSGRDRSSWATGVARLLDGELLDVARDGLTPLGGHFCQRTTCPLHGFFDTYESWLRAQQRSHDRSAFREWVREDYYPEPYRARLTAELPDSLSVRPGGGLRFQTLVSNESTSDWTATADPKRGIRLGVRILGPFDRLPDDMIARFRSRHGSAPRDVWRQRWRGTWAPGERRLVDTEITAPESSGIWVAQLDMVDEGVHWFSDLGGPGILVPFRVLPDSES